MATFPRESSGNPRCQRKRLVKAPVLTERKTSGRRKHDMDDTQNLIELRSMIYGTKAPIPTFARFAGLAPRTVYSYLARKRPVPPVAIAAGRWASLMLGRRVKLPGNEIMHNMGFETPAHKPIGKRMFEPSELPTRNTVLKRPL